MRSRTYSGITPIRAFDLVVVLLTIASVAILPCFKCQHLLPSSYLVCLLVATYLPSTTAPFFFDPCDGRYGPIDLPDDAPPCAVIIAPLMRPCALDSPLIRPQPPRAEATIDAARLRTHAPVDSCRRCCVHRSEMSRTDLTFRETSPAAHRDEPQLPRPS